MNLDSKITHPQYGDGVALEQLTSLTPKPQAPEPKPAPSQAEQPKAAERQEPTRILPGQSLPDIESAFWANKWSEIMAGNPTLAEADPQMRIIIKALTDKANRR